jgi:uncharacterized protein
MDELLANIRRAITEDNGRAERTAAPDAPVIRGSMREMRVSLEPAANAPAANRAQEIRELRDRVSNQVARQEDAQPAAPPSPKSNGFADLLTGGAARPEPVRPVPPPADRPGYLQPLGASYFESPVPALKQTIVDEPDPASSRPPPPWEEEELAPPPVPVPVAEARPRAQVPEAKYLPPFLSRTAEPPPQQPRSFAPADDTVMSAGTSEAAAQSFQRLAETVMQRALGERPVEEVTRELLRGMLRQWLDENLPQLVERIVREEIERVARRGPVR